MTSELAWFTSTISRAFKRPGWSRLFLITLSLRKGNLATSHLNQKKKLFFFQPPHPKLKGAFVYSSGQYNHIKFDRSLTSSSWQRRLHILNVKKRDDDMVVTAPRNFFWWQEHHWIISLTGTSDLMDNGGPHSEKRIFSSEASLLTNQMVYRMLICLTDH